VAGVGRYRKVKTGIAMLIQKDFLTAKGAKEYAKNAEIFV
jgi:hypothetical protein